MKHIAPVTPLLNRPPAKSASPRFGFVGPNPILGVMDFVTPGVSTLAQNKLVYGSVIGSRVKKSRSWNERRENMTRDFQGWYSWFMGSPLMQTALALWVFPMFARDASKLLVRQHKYYQNPLIRFATSLIEPAWNYKIISEKQLEQRAGQVKAGMMKAGVAPERIAQTMKNFETAGILRSTLSGIGILFTIAYIGIGIMLINIALTQLNVNKKKKLAQRQGLPASPEQPAPPAKQPLRADPAQPLALRPYSPVTANRPASYSQPFARPGMAISATPNSNTFMG